MKKLFTKEVVIALSVIVSVAILVTGINYLKGVNILKPTNYYNIQYHNVNRSYGFYPCADRRI